MAGSSPPESSWGTPLPQGGTLEVLGLGGARKTLNWTEPAEKESWAGPAETKESWAGPAETKESWAGPAGERTLRAPGDGAGPGADSASSWDGAGPGADSASSWDGAGLGMPAARTDTSGGSNTLVISPGQRGASEGVVAILARDSGLAGLARADSGLAGMMRADSGLAGLK